MSARKRSPFLRGCSALAAAIALAGMWSPAANAQVAASSAQAASRAPDVQTMVRMRNAPEVRAIATEAYMGDLGISLDAPVIPNAAPPVPNGGGPIPANPAPMPNTNTGEPNQTIAAIEGSVTTVGAAAPTVAARASGAVSAQGTIAVQSGTIIENRSATKDQIQITSSEAVLNWTTLDTATIDSTTDAINFLPAGTELEFIGLGAEYTVLNRIFGTPNASGIYRGIAFEGTVTSRLSDAGPIGGNVWFYSPGGILLSSTAVFNVGGLVLTSSDLTQIDKAGTELNFRGVAEPGSQVMIADGAQVDASNYAVVWAPRIEQAGTVRSTGNVSYTAAEEGQLIVTGGLFDMSVSVGTEDRNGIVHTGTTGGATPVDNPTRAITMTSVPKNDFVTMLVGGSVGYANASAATVSNGVVILTSGDSAKPNSGNIEFGASTFNSSTLTQAFGDVSIKLDGQNQAFSVGNSLNESDFFIVAQDEISLSATGGSSIIAFDNLFLIASDGQTGGTININVDDAGRNDDSSISGLLVNGNLSLLAQGNGTNDNGVNGVGGDGTGGTINITMSQGGEIFTTGNFAVNTAAQAGFGTQQSGNATGGDINLNMTGTNTRLLIGGAMTMTSAANPAVNPTAPPSAGQVGGDSTAGNITLSLLDGRSTVAGDVTINSSAEGSPGQSAGGAQNNGAFGGDVSITMANGSHNWGGNLTLDASSNSGFSYDAAGNSVGGSVGRAIVNVSLDNATLAIGGDADIDARTEGDLNGAGAATAIDLSLTNGSSLTAADLVLGAIHNTREASSASIAGSVAVNVDGSTLDTSFFGIATDATTVSTAASNQSSRQAGDISIISSNGGLITSGGATFSASADSANLLDGAAEYNGGDISLTADGGVFDFTGLVLIDTSTTVARGGDMTGLASTAGDVNISLLNAGAAMSFTNLTVNADATGSNSQDNYIGDGGNAIGGNVTIDQQSGDFSASAVRLNADARGFVGGFQIATAGDAAGDGGDAQGGVISLILNGDSFTAAGLQIDAGAQGAQGGFADSVLGASAGGANGDAFGGSIDIQALNGTFDVTGAGVVFLSASAQGGDGSFNSGTAGEVGGTATGGTINFLLDGAAVNFVNTNLTLDVSAVGGGGTFTGPGSSPLGGLIGPGLPGDGGSGTGGAATFTSASGSSNLTSITLDASGTGGTGGVADRDQNGGIGGAGVGGTVDFIVADGGAGIASLLALNLDVTASGGSGGAGGRAGAAEAGFGGTGGTASGGTANLIVRGAGTSYAVNDGVVSFNADARGGAGGTGGDDLLGGLAGDGGAGGSATGGTVAIIAESGTTVTLQSVSVDPFNFAVAGTGGAGGSGGDLDLTSGGIQGSGGDGGTGTGGSPILRAIGGTITGGDIDITAIGTGGNGGLGGDDGNAVLGPSGNGGNGTGGTPSIETFDGSPGIITLGSVLIDATALAGGGTVTGTTAGGQITITDGSADPAGLISMTSLTVTATGTAATAGIPSLTIASDSGPITVTNNVNADVAGDIIFDFDGDGQLVAGNDVLLTAGGSIVLTHTNNTTPVDSLDVGRDFTATAAQDFDAGAASRIIASREVTITAQNIGFDTIEAGNDNIFDAGEIALTLNATNGSITAGPIGSLSALSGMDLDATQAISIGDMSVNDGPITIDAGTTLSTGDITINQGGFVSNESIAINAGGDTSLGAVAAIDGLTINSGGSLDALSLRATGITATAASAVDIGDATIFNGVAGGGGITITGTSIILDSADASTLVGNDIALDATAGGITLGTINTEAFLDVTATGDIVFDRLTGAGVFLTTTGGNVTGNFASTDRNINTARPRDVQITAPGDVVVTAFSTINDVEVTAGSFDTDSIVTGNGAAGVASDVIVNVTRSATIRSADVQGFIDVDAGSIVIGDIAIQAGTFLDSADGDITINSIVTDGQVVANSAANLLLGSSEKRGTDTIGNEAMTFTAAGDVTVTGVIDSHDSINLTAGGVVDTQQLVAFDNVNVTAGTSANIAGVTTTVFGTGNTVTINAPIITLGASSLIGGLVANASAGDLDITGDVSGGAAFNLDATGDINFTTLTSSRQINLNAGANIVGGSTSGTGGRTIFNEDHVFIAGGDVTLTGTVFGKDNLAITAGGTIDANAIGANANATLTGGNVIVDTSDVAGLLTVTSNTGGIVFTGLIQSAGGIAVNSAVDLDFVRIENSDANLSLTAAGNVSGVDAVNTAPVGSGGLDRTIINAGGDITLAGVAQSVDDGVFLTAGGNIDVASIDAADTISAIATGAVTVDTVRNANNFATTLRGSSVTLNTGTLIGNLVLDATGGDVAGTGLITVGGGIDLDATGNIGFGSLAANGLFNANAGGNIAFTSASSTNTMTFDAGGSILGGTISTDQALADSSFTAGTDVVLGDVTTRIFTVTAGNDISLGNVDALGRTIRGIAVDLNAGGALSFASLTSGRGIDIDVGSVTGGGSILADDGVDILASSIDVGDVEVLLNGAIVLEATAGDVVAGNITNTTFGITTRASGSVTAGNLLTTGTANASDITVDAGGDATFGDATAGNQLTITVGGNLVAGNLTSNVVSPGTVLTVGGNANFTSFTALQGPANIQVGGALTGGDIYADGVLTINSASLDVGDVTSTFLLDIDTTVGDLVAGTVTSSSGANLNSAGSIAIGDATAGGLSLVLDAVGDISTGVLTTTGGLTDLRINTTANVDYASINASRLVNIRGDVVTGGNIVSAAQVDILASSIDVGDVAAGVGFVVLATTGGDLNTGDLSSQNFGLILTSANNANLGNLDASAGIALNTVGNATLGDANAGNNLSFDIGGDLVAGLLDAQATSPGMTLTVAGAADIAGASSSGLLDVNIGGALTGGDFSGASLTTIDAATIDVASVASVNNSVFANATSGDAAFGAINAAINITVDAAGTPAIGSFDVGNNLTVTGASVELGAGTIAGQLSLNSTAGDVVLSLDGAEQIVVGGAANLSSAGNIVVTHTNNTSGTVSLDATGNILAQAFGGAIDAQPGSILSGNEVFLLAQRDISVDNVRGVPGIVITAGGNVLVNNATASGPQGASNFTGITIDAGLDPFTPSAFYDNSAEARITGAVDSYANITVRSGGNAVFATGSSTVASDRLFVQTGDDIIVETGASLSSARNPSTTPDPSNPFNGVGALELDAGGLLNLLSIPLTPVASLAVGGTLDANSGAIIASAGAIDGLGGAFIGSSIALDIADAPAAGVTQSDDNGLLSASCLQGNVCVGNIVADNVIEIGEDSSNGVIQAIIEQGTVDASAIRITTRNDIVMGTNGIATTLNAADLFSATSTTGDVDLRDASITSGLILIDAAGSLIGSASLSSTGDIGITVGQDVNAAAVVTGGELTTVAGAGGALEGFFAVPGSIAIGTLQVGLGDVNFSANGDIVLGTVVVPGTDINLSAGGLAQIDFTDTALNVGLDGGSVVFGTIDAGGDVTADSGSTIDIGTITAGNDIDLLAVGAIAGGDLTAAGSLFLDGGSIAIGNASANLIGLFSGSDILFDLLQSPNGISLIATNGVIGTNTGPGDIESDGDVSLTAQAIGVNDITSGGFVLAEATAGDASFGTVNAVTDIDVTASGTPTLANAISGGNTSITGQSVTFDNGTVAGDLNLTATGGNVSSNGTVTVGGAIALTATGDIGFGALEAQGGDFLVDAGGAVGFASATGSALIEISAASSLQGSSIDAAGNVSLEGSNVAVTDLLSGGSVDVTAFAGDIALANTIAAGQIDLAATGDILADHAEAGTNFLASADGSFTTGLNSIITGGDIQIVAGTLVNLGNSTAGGLIDVQGSQIDFVSLVAGSTIDLLTTPAVTASVGSGDITGTTVTAGAGASSMDAFGSIQIGGTMTIGGSLTLDAANDIAINVTEVQGGDFVATAGGLISYDTTTVDGSLDFLAQTGDILGTGNVETAGAVVMESTQGSIAGVQMLVGNTLDLLASGTIDFGDIALLAGTATVAAGDNITLQDVIGGDGTDIDIASSNGTVSFADLQAQGFVSVFAGNGSATGNAIDAGSTATIEGDTVDVGAVIAGGDITGIATTGSFLLGSAQSGGSIGLSVATDLASGSLDAANDVSIDAGSFDGTSLVAGDAIVIATAGDAQFTDAQAGNTIDIVTGGNATADSLDAASAIAVDADGLAQFGAVSTGATGNIAISGHDGVILNTLVGNTATLLSVAGPVSVDTDIDLAGSLDAEGDSVFLRSTHDLAVSATANSGSVDIATTGLLNALGASATTGISLVSDSDVIVSDNVVAQGNLVIDAGNLADIQALASGVVVDVSSADIAIGSTGAVGESDRTQGITFNAFADDVTLGGAGGAGGYELGNDEFSRVFSGGDVTLNAVSASTGGATVTIDTLDVVAGTGTSSTSNTIGQGGGLFVEGGTIDIIGEAVVTNAADDTFLGLAASGDIFLDAETGLLEVQVDSGIYAGSILIEAQNFYAMTQAALADIQGLGIEDIDARLADSDGMDNAEGVIRAGTLDITTIASDVFIQNTVPGTEFDERRGFTVDTLFISDPSTDPQPIVINGVISGTTGIDAIPLADISSTFDPGSTINGCLIADPSSCIVIVMNPAPGDNPLRDLIDEEIEDDPVGTGTIDTGLVELREDPLRQDDPLIDEPVTGAGNEDLWEFDPGEEENCERAEDGTCLAEAAE